jgi:hypothetical protein
MPVWYLVGTGIKVTQKGSREIPLFDGPIYTKEEALKQGFQSFNGEYELFETTTTDNSAAKGQWRARMLRSGKNTSDILKPIYNVKESS